MQILNNKSKSRTKLTKEICAVCKEQFGTYRRGVKTCSKKCKAISSSLNTVGEKRPVVCVGTECSVQLATGEYASFDIKDKSIIENRYWSRRVSSVGTKYAQTSVNGKPEVMHRLILKPPKEHVIDHRDGDGLNNKRSNLRICLNKFNLASSQSRVGTSKFKGVSKLKNRKWRSYIAPNGRQIGLGVFEDEKIAAEAYNKAAKKYFGKYALLNDISSPGHFVQPHQQSSTDHT